MGQVLLVNNAYTTLAIGCAAGDGTVTVASSALFPSVTTVSGNWFYACFQDTLANLEIMKVTNVSGAVWTVSRVIGGTTARAFTAGSVIELRITAETLSDVTTANVTTNIQNSTPQYLTAVSGTNTIVATLPAPFTAYAGGQKFHFVAASANTGPATININSVGAISITKVGNVALSAGDIVAGGAYILIYDGVRFQLSGGAGGGASAGGVLYENNTTISSNYTLTTGKNAMTVGPLSVATGVTLSIPTGQRLVIL
jgi:hypothetical protein